MNDSWREIKGHDAIIARLKRMTKTHRLPHAILFAGTAGIGKKKTAEALAETLLCGSEENAPCGVCESCRLAAAGSHPDLTKIIPSGKGKAAKSIKIDQIRELQKDVSRFPVLAKRRAVIIDDAQLMNETAQNSLLKTLEEPVGEVFFIIVTSSLSALLPTVISRSVVFRFGEPDAKIATDILTARGAPPDKARKLASAAGGSAGRAIELYENGGTELLYDAEIFLSKLRLTDTEQIFAKSEAMTKLTKEQAVEWLMHLNYLLRELLAAGLGCDGSCRHDGAGELLAASALTVGQIFPLLRIVAESRRRLLANVNMRLFWESFFLQTTLAQS